MAKLPVVEPRTIYALPDLWESLPFFHGKERCFWLVTASGAFFRLLQGKLERAEAPFATPAGMTLEAVDWDAKRKHLRGVAVSQERNQVALLAQGEKAMVVGGPALLGESGRKFLFTSTGLVLVTWKESAGTWEAFRFDAGKWVSLGPTVQFPRCTLFVAEDRTQPGRLVVVEKRSGAVAIYDGKAWVPCDIWQVGVRAMITDPMTGHVIAFDNDPGNCAQRLDGETWTEIPYRIEAQKSKCVVYFGVGFNAVAAGGEEIFFRHGRIEGQPETVGLVWNGKTNLLTAYGQRCLTSQDGLHVEGDCALFREEGKVVPPFVRLTDGKVFESRSKAGLPEAPSNEDGDDEGAAFVTEAKTGTQIMASETGLVTLTSGGTRKQTKHDVDFQHILALPGGGVFLGGCERLGKRALRFAFFDGTTLSDLPTDAKAQPAGLPDEVRYDRFSDAFVDSRSGHVVFGVEEEGIGNWSAYLGEGKWQPVATGPISTQDREVAWDDARQQLLKVGASVDGVPMVGVIAWSFSKLLKALGPPAANRFDMTKMKKSLVLCSAPKPSAKKVGKGAKPAAALELSKGLVLNYESADSDVCDTYAFTVRDVGKGSDYLRVAYSPGPKKNALGFTLAALESARRSIIISQLDHELGGEKEDAISKALPPFLVSRKVLREMRKGKATLDLDGPGKVTVKVRAAKRHIQRGDLSVEVDVLHGKSEALELWVLDDEALPLVIRRMESGGNYWKLLDVNR